MVMLVSTSGAPSKVHRIMAKVNEHTIRRSVARTHHQRAAAQQTSSSRPTLWAERVARRTSPRSCVWGFPVAERPILLRHFGEHDHHVLGPNLGFGLEPFDEGGVELSLQFHRAPGVEGDIDDE